MINRGRVLQMGDGAEFASNLITTVDGHPMVNCRADEMAELCRVYLAWLDAPEGSAESHCDAVADWIEVEVSDEQATQINGKRVRLVEVK